MADETLLSVPNDEEAVDEEADTFFFFNLWAFTLPSHQTWLAGI